MEMEIIEGKTIYAYDHEMQSWCKAKIIAIDAVRDISFATIEFVEGDNDGLEWNETFEYLNNPDFYREYNNDPAPPGFWTDPAGGVHSDDEEDPAAMYE